MGTETRDHAVSLDEADALRFTRDEFVIPTVKQVTSNTLKSSTPADDTDKKCTYLCGNSLGLQPKRTATHLRQYLDTWATQGVQGHFKPLADSPLPTWLDADARAAEMAAPIVGAQPAEVAVMQTLTMNLHLLMAALYRPDVKGKHKIILESKAFPSDHFAVESQIRHHGLSPAESMICIESPVSKDNLISTYDILSIISQHAATTALVLLPGIQYYTGQLLDIPTITAFAHKHEVVVIWDLAHAVGNVPLSLHDWDVDAAAWCSYKYLNSGPGCIGGLFVHERLSGASNEASEAGKAPEPATGGTSSSELEGIKTLTLSDSPAPLPRLSGWWGNSKLTRFIMATDGFVPAPGAAGFQLSNPSVLDITALCASLEVFAQAGGVKPLREKSKRLTAYLEGLLRSMTPEHAAQFRIITPSDPEERGAQLSVLLEDGLLGPVMEGLEKRGVIVDERKPNVVRVAPAPLYNTFTDCFDFVAAFGEALDEARK